MENIKYNSEDLTSHHGIAVIIKNENKEILMQEHIKYGFWTIPVGKIKNNQTVENGLKEEILEECNIEVKKNKELIVRNYPYIRNGKNITVTGHLFEVLEYIGEIKNNEPQKHKQQIFLPLSKIKTLPYLSDLTLLYLETQNFKRDAKI